MKVGGRVSSKVLAFSNKNIDFQRQRRVFHSTSACLVTRSRCFVVLGSRVVESVTHVICAMRNRKTTKWSTRQEWCAASVQGNRFVSREQVLSLNTWTQCCSKDRWRYTLDKPTAGSMSTKQTTPSTGLLVTVVNTFIHPTNNQGRAAILFLLFFFYIIVFYISVVVCILIRKNLNTVFQPISALVEFSPVKW